MSKARIVGQSLVVTIGGKDNIVANATVRFDGTYRWFGYGRFSKKTHPTICDALKAAAKAIGYKIEA